MRLTSEPNASRLKADLSARVRHFGVLSIPEKFVRKEDSM
jgi:hypothetical protein